MSSTLDSFRESQQCCLKTWLQGGGIKAPLWLHGMGQGKENERLEHPRCGSKCLQAAQR